MSFPPRAFHRVVFGLLLIIVGATSQAAELRVFAAASLSDSLKAIGTAYEKESGDKLLFNFASSSLLARQIQEGAPADLFFSADEEKMDGLEKAGLLLPGTRQSVLSNTLVFVVPVDAKGVAKTPAELLRNGRIALAEPRSVPAGIYARIYLSKLGLWEELQPRIVPTENVRAALAAVEAGNVAVGIVYRTDAAISSKVKIALAVPAQEGPVISYPLAVLAGTKDPARSRRLAEHLGSAKAARTFESFGFVVRR